MPTKTGLSVVLPVYNEEGCVGTLIAEIAAATAGVCGSVEIIVVDDGSVDGSAREVTEAFQKLTAGTGASPAKTVFTPRLVTLPQQMGQSTALLQGFHAAQGAMILSMDADGQYDPAEIPAFVAKMNEYDMVCGWRRNRSDGRARRIASIVANTVRNLITGDSLTDAGCTFRIMRADCREAIRPVEGNISGCEFFFHPLFIRLHGFTVTELPVSHRPRTRGTSKYHLVRGRWYTGLTASLNAVRLVKKLYGRYYPRPLKREEAGNRR